ncbi:MAG: glycosyltransferase [Sulfurospirillum sp.]
MKISAIIPTFNRADFLPFAINSIKNQSYSVDEILIIDDGSTDNTQEVLKNFDNIRVIKTKKFGVSHARNIGIKKAKNRWVAFLDSDDIWMEDKIKKQVELHKKSIDIYFSHTGERWVRDGGKVRYPKSLKKPQGECFLENISTCKIATSSVLMHISVFEEIGYFDEKLKVCEDYDLWLRVTKKYKIGFIDEELIVKNAGHEQLSSHIFAIDRYHIYSLKKFLDSKFKDEVKQEIIKKCKILIKGAKKHQNQDIIDRYSKILNQTTQQL